MEGFILPAPTVFGIRRGEWLRDLSLVIPRLTPDEIDALSVSATYFPSLSPHLAYMATSLSCHSLSFIFVILGCVVVLVLI